MQLQAESWDMCDMGYAMDLRLKEGKKKNVSWRDNKYDSFTLPVLQNTDLTECQTLTESLKYGNAN